MRSQAQGPTRLNSVRALCINLQAVLAAQSLLQWQLDGYSLLRLIGLQAGWAAPRLQGLIRRVQGLIRQLHVCAACPSTPIGLLRWDLACMDPMYQHPSPASIALPAALAIHSGLFLFRQTIAWP